MGWIKVNIDDVVRNCSNLTTWDDIFRGS